MPNWATARRRSRRCWIPPACRWASRTCWERSARPALEMIGPGADGAVVCERHGDELHILAHAGFDGAGVPRSWPVKGSFVEMMIQQNRTASLEDAALRPDLKMLPVAGRPRFGAAALLAAAIEGQARRRRHDLQQHAAAVDRGAVPADRVARRAVLARTGRRCGSRRKSGRASGRMSSWPAFSNRRLRPSAWDIRMGGWACQQRLRAAHRLQPRGTAIR